MTFRDEPGMLFPEFGNQVVVAVVERRHEVSGGPSRFSAANVSVLNEHHFFSRFAKAVGNAYPADAPANNYYIRCFIFSKFVIGDGLAGIDPEGQVGACRECGIAYGGVWLHSAVQYRVEHGLCKFSSLPPVGFLGSPEEDFEAFGKDLTIIIPNGPG